MLQNIKGERKNVSQEDKIYNKLFVAIPVLLAIFGVVRGFNYVDLGYLLLFGVILIKYFFKQEKSN